MADKVRWGIMSTSRHAARVLIPALHASERSEVAAVASRDAELARQYADENRIPTSYGSYEDLLADPNVDVVYIPLPNNLHKTWGLRAAQAGKHMLCEKPFALNADEAQTMVQAFRTAGLKAAEAFQWRPHPQGQRTRELVRQGAIGDLLLIDAGFSFPLERPDDFRWIPELGGGALYDIGCYPISLTRFITGQEPLSVTAQAHWNKSGADDLVVATLEFPGGVFAHINCSFLLPLRRYFEVIGTGGSLEVNRAYNPVDIADDVITRRGPDREVIEQIPLPKQNSYALMVEDFSAAVLEDRDPMFPAEDAVLNMRVIDAIFQAVREGRRVEVAR
ncbi:MAG: Gfo/Idh/MocA family oxidoreductase [Chloroflexi bacterium]|nr:Gfo/Idh/MocA family oxidoreductase [Chloroflexota bacterium]